MLFMARWLLCAIGGCTRDKVLKSAEVLMGDTFIEMSPLNIAKITSQQLITKELFDVW